MQPKQEQLKHNFHQLTRGLTLALVLMIITGAVLLWYFEIDSTRHFFNRNWLIFDGISRYILQITLSKLFADSNAISTSSRHC